MVKNALVGVGGILFGILIGYLIILYTPLFLTQKEKLPLQGILPPKKQVVGFLPYWLLNKAQTDYSKYINTLSYFNLTVDSDGKILKLMNPREEEPGWHTLKSGAVDKYLETASKKNLNLSLTVFNGNSDSIDEIISDPTLHAENLIADIKPLMKQYKFKDLNLDIESTKDSSPSAKVKFSQFVKEVKNGLDREHLGTLTVDIPPKSLISDVNLISPKDIGEIADYLVIMTYDYHYIGSLVSGPVAPIGGAESIAEFDVNVVLDKALTLIPSHKIILGTPLYGYEWETINNFPRAANIPATGLIASSNRVSNFLKNCASCSAEIDPDAKEAYLIYKDADLDIYHQIFYPDSKSTQAKIDLAKTLDLGGIALWALGYEGEEILAPLKNYR